MAIQNEIIKVIAQVELDEQGHEEAAENLKKLNDKCADLRKEIEKTETEMAKLAAAGKKDSQEFKNLGKHLNQTKDQLKASTKVANQYARALGLNQMTYNQLKAHASKLRKELNSLHKESNPISRKARKLSTKPCTRVSPRISPLPGQTLSWLTLPLSHRKKTRKGSYKWQT